YRDTQCKEKPFGCLECHGEFARWDNFLRHIRDHMVEKPFVCEGCGKKFNRSDNLKRHQSI
ncbi:hypothetical protein BJ085DRAFT_8878, partial [Dimargaris cristalligena]